MNTDARCFECNVRLHETELEHSVCRRCLLDKLDHFEAEIARAQDKAASLLAAVSRLRALHETANFAEYLTPAECEKVQEYRANLGGQHCTKATRLQDFIEGLLKARPLEYSKCDRCGGEFGEWLCDPCSLKAVGQ